MHVLQVHLIPLVPMPEMPRFLITVLLPELWRLPARVLLLHARFFTALLVLELRLSLPPMLLSLVTALSGMQALLLRLLRLEFLLQVLLLSAMLVL
jgi:hypothetical protein